MNYPSLIIILPDLRSSHNVGAIFRTADAVGAAVWTAGYTPHPPIQPDPRPPHVIAAVTRQLAKTALGAETTVPHKHFENPETALDAAREAGYTTLALEQAPGSRDLFSYQPAPNQPLALIAGNEVTGLTPGLLTSCDIILELPMLGSKESLNVAVAAGIALYQLRFGQPTSGLSEAPTE